MFIVNVFQLNFLSSEKYIKKYTFEFMFHRGKFLSHWVKYWFQLLTLAVFLPHPRGFNLSDPRDTRREVGKLSTSIIRGTEILSILRTSHFSS